MPPPNGILKKGKKKKHRHHLNDDDRSRPVHADIPIRSIEFPPTPPADVASPTSASSTSSRKRRRDNEDANEPRNQRSRRTPPESTPEMEWELKRKHVDRTFQYDPHDVEPPSQDACLPWLKKDEFGAYESLTDTSKIDNTILKPCVSDLMFPDMLDDSKDMTTIMVRVPKKPKKGSSRSKEKRRKARREREEAFPSPTPVPESVSVPTPATPPASRPEPRRPPRPVKKVTPAPEPTPYERQKKCLLLTQLPFDIRQLIYREMLVASTPVAVHSNWRKIYQREKPQIGVQFLRTCRFIYDEAISTLYSENIFYYRIRDAVNTAATLGDIRHPALTFGNPGAADDADAEDSGSDWERDQLAPRARINRNADKRVTRSAARKKKTMEDWDINIPKFAHLVRHIVVEAESNRLEAATKECMARAIAVFGFKDQTDNIEEAQERRSIRNLTLRVTPSRHSGLAHGYTFVDFFDKESRVISAVRSIDCRIFRIEISRSVLREDVTAEIHRKKEATDTIEVDFYHQRALYNLKSGAEDVWKGDVVMQQKRMDCVLAGRLRLESLAQEVKTLCEEMNDGKSPDLADSGEVQTPLEDDDDLWNGEEFADYDPGVEDFGPTAGQVLAQVEGQSNVVDQDEAAGEPELTVEGESETGQAVPTIGQESAHDETLSFADTVAGTQAHENHDEEQGALASTAQDGAENGDHMDEDESQVQQQAGDENE
ncbi:hypothetical protein CC79DRAFT_1329489 [Sarocladium strictum]